MKRKKTEIQTAEFRVWCNGCSIRVAPQEEQIAADGQTYHPRCYAKHLIAASKDGPRSKGRH